MKTLRLHLPVLDAADVSEYLDLLTDVDGVVAAIVDEPAAAVEVIVRSDASALLVREQLHMALTLGVASA